MPVLNTRFAKLNPCEVLYLCGLASSVYNDVGFSNIQTTMLVAIYRHLINRPNFSELYKQRRRPPALVSLAMAIESKKEKSNGISQWGLFKVQNTPLIDSIIEGDSTNDANPDILSGVSEFIEPTISHFKEELNLSSSGRIPISKLSLLSNYPIYNLDSYFSSLSTTTHQLFNTHLVSETVSSFDNSLENNEEPIQNSNEEPFLSSHDLQVMYTDTFGLVGNTVVKVVNIIGNEKQSKPMEYVELYKSGNKYILDINSKRSDLKDIDFTLPVLGAINTDKYVVFTTRLHKKSSPARYRKGLCFETVSFDNVSKNECKKVGLKDIIDMDRDSLHTQFLNMASFIFKPLVFTFEEALNSVLSFERLSTAFSSSYSIKLDSEVDSIYILRGIYPIAEYDDEAKGFRTFIDIFNEDLLKHGVNLIN